MLISMLILDILGGGVVVGWFLGLTYKKRVVLAIFTLRVHRTFLMFRIKFVGSVNLWVKKGSERG